MPEFKGRLRTPRLSGAPASPITGEMYYDTTTNKLLWWNGSVWIDPTGAPVAHASSHKSGGSDLIRLHELGAPTLPVGFGGQILQNIADPVQINDGASKGYVDNVGQGVTAKQTVQAASTGNVAIPGVTSGLVIDGVTIANYVGGGGPSGRVLLKNQTNQAQNGIYVFQTGIGLSRAADMDSVEEFPGATVWVSEGAVNTDTGWVCTNDRSMVLDTTGVTFIQFTSAASGAYAYANLTGAAIVPTQNLWTAIGAASGTWTETLESDAALFNPATGIFTCKQAGIYAVSCTTGFANNTTGARGAGIYKNGTLYTGDIVSAGTGTNSGGARTFGIVSLAVGDTVQAGFYTNGAAPNVASASLIIYSLNGPQGQKGDPGGTEYAMRGVGSNFSATGSTWVRPVMGSPTDQSTNATDCLRFNADGTITILKSGWYSFGCEYQITGLAAQNGVQFGFWETSDDTVPASAGTNYKQEIPYPNVGTPIISGHWTAYLPAGYRIGLGVFNRGATATFTLNRWAIARLGAGPQGPQGIGVVPKVSVLPSSPADGDMVMFQDANMGNAGIVWQLRYRASISDAYKWEFIGGSPLQHEVNVSESPASATTWVNLTTDGPKVTCPLAGIYNCMWGASVHLTVRNIIGQCGIAIGDTTPAVPYISEASPDTGSAYAAGAVRANNAIRKRMTVAANDLLKLRYYGTLATAQNAFDYRWLDVTPMRVG